MDGGLSNLGAYKKIYEAYSGKKFEDATMLDWGCGCGRMFRHIPKEAQARAHGADVDRVNIAWDRENMPFGTFSLLYPSTPFPYEDNTFDLVFGTSVITHLDEKEQFFWLQELNRISRGIVVLSIHGFYRASLEAGSLSGAYIQKWLDRGFLDAANPLPDIADVVDADYYRSTSHTWSYVHKEWTKYVDVLDILLGTISTHDAVVCRKKA